LRASFFCQKDAPPADIQQQSNTYISLYLSLYEHMYSIHLINPPLWPNAANTVDAVTLEPEEQIQSKSSHMVHSSENQLKRKTLLQWSAQSFRASSRNSAHLAAFDVHLLKILLQN
jgi:hypothetical protein